MGFGYIDSLGNFRVIIYRLGDTHHVRELGGESAALEDGSLAYSLLWTPCLASLETPEKKTLQPFLLRLFDQSKEKHTSSQGKRATIF